MTEITHAVQTPAETTRTFLDSFAVNDHESALALVDPAIDYVNVGYTRMRGKKRLDRLFRAAAKYQLGFSVEWINITVDGPVVITERIDELSFGRFRMQFWVCGRFEVVDGLITVWRDYFDSFDFFVKAPARGLVALIMPRTQKPLPKPLPKPAPKPLPH